VEVIRPDLRDPEYGRRVMSLRQRLTEQPGRPLVVVVGSSRAAMAVCPRAWEEVRPGGDSDPLLFNLSRVGGGPLTNLMTLRRLYASGFCPAAVVLEYWPPLLHQDGPFREAERLDPDELYDTDRPFVRAYLPDADRVERRILATRLNPVYARRAVWVRGVVPSWLPRDRQYDAAVRPLDGWGWLPGLDAAGLGFAPRSARLAHHEGTYRSHLAALRVDPAADRAVREAVALARENGAAVAFAFLPESTEFRSWYSPAAEELGQAYLGQLCLDLGVPVMDARDWLADELLADGFHPTRAGAEAFTRRFGPAIAAFGRPQ